MAISIGIGNYIRSSLYNRTSNKSPFHPSLVDYWSFSGKSNSDADRDKIKGIKGNILNAYNFSWSLSSGYGQYLEDWRTYTFNTDNADTNLHAYYGFSIREAKTTNPFFYKDGGISKSYKVNIRGIRTGEGLKYVYGLDESHVINITENGEYELPAGDMAEFQCTFVGKCGIVVEQVQNYQGALVFDGIASKLEGEGKLPILTDYTLIMRRKYLGEPIIPLSTPIATLGPFGQSDFSNYSFVFENGLQNDLSSYTSVSYGDEQKIALVADSDWTWQTKSKYRGVTTFNNPSGRQIQSYLYVGGGLSGQTNPSKIAVWDIALYSKSLTEEEIQGEINVMQYGTPNPVFALNFDNFAYKAVDYPDFATGKVTTNKIVVDSTTETFNGAIAVAMNPEADTGEPIEVPAYKLKISGMDAYNMPEDFYFIAVLGENISGKPTEQWVQQFSKDGIYNIPAITLEDNIYNISIATMIGLDKPVEIEVLYDSSITTNFPSVKQIFP